MTKTSADLWSRPPTSHSVASEDAVALGTVCEAIGVVLRAIIFCDAIIFLAFRISFAHIDLAPHGFQ